MSQGFIEQVSVAIIEKAATTVTDTTYTKYVDMRKHNSFSQEVIFTAGVAGTLSYKIYGTMKPFLNEDDAQAGDSGSVFQDVSLGFFGTSSITASDIKTDSAGLGGKYTFLKIAATVTTSDATTALYAYGTKSF